MNKPSISTAKILKPKLELQQATFRPSNQRGDSSKPRVISFVGNIQQSIDKIISDIGCCQHCEFKSILLIFAQKLDKLRADRELLKEKYVQDVHKLETKIKLLEEQNTFLQQKLQDPLDLSHKISSLRDDSRYKNPKFVRAYEDDENEESTNREVDENDFNTINKIALQYNICGQELQYIIKQYLQTQDVAKSNTFEQKKLKNLYQKLIKEREIMEIRTKVSKYTKNFRNKENIY